MRSRYKILNKNGIFFVTSTIVNWIPVFTDENYFNLLIDTLKFYQVNNKLIIYAYVLMENHFHLIISNDNVSKIMQSIKKYSAKKIIRNLDIDRKVEILKEFRNIKPDYKTTSNHKVWQESFHPQEIISMEMLKQKIEYIHYNPVRKNLVINPEDWKYSSAMEYHTGKKGLLDISRIV
ncbi:MAG: transposase [Ignavibacteria bacterium]|nr:transposase [Ignavibacteria bacterium]